MVKKLYSCTTISTYKVCELDMHTVTWLYCILKVTIETYEMHTRVNCLYKQLQMTYVIIIYWGSCTNERPKLTSDARGIAIFRRQITYPCTKYKARKVYLAGRHVKKSRKLDEDSTLRSTFLTPKAVKFLQILLAQDIFTC